MAISRLDVPLEHFSRPCAVLVGVVKLDQATFTDFQTALLPQGPRGSTGFKLYLKSALGKLLNSNVTFRFPATDCENTLT